MKKLLKNYFRILLITLAIQGGMLVLGTGLARGLTYDVVILFCVVGYIGSLVVDICLSVKLDAPVYQKLICTFLMLSNYTPVMLLWVAVKILIVFFEMLPSNLG